MSTTTTTNGTPARQQAVEPAHGTVKWLHRMKDGVGAIQINGVAYAVAELRNGERLEGYRLARHDASGAVVYRDIDTTWQAWSCDCEDFIWKHSQEDNPNGGCKHIRGLRAALAQN